MIDKMPDDSTIALLNRTLNRTSVRAAVSASNIANVETPGYRAMRAEFQEAIRLAGDDLESAGCVRNGALPSEKVVMREAPVTRMRADGNTVDIDAEMTQLASLGGRFQAAAQLLRKRFALFRYALTDGRG